MSENPQNMTKNGVAEANVAVTGFIEAVAFVVAPVTEAIAPVTMSIAAVTEAIAGVTVIKEERDEDGNERNRVGNRLDECGVGRNRVDNARNESKTMPFRGKRSDEKSVMNHRRFVPSVEMTEKNRNSLGILITAIKEERCLS